MDPELKVPPICLVLRYFTVGGLERVVIGLANGLAALGVDVRVVVLGAAKRNALITELDAAVEVVVLPSRGFFGLRRLRELSAGRIVHLHFGDGRIHPLARLALAGRCVVVSYHSVYTHKRTWWLNRIDRLVSGRARAVVAVSAAVQDFCIGEVRLDPSVVTVIPNGIALRAAASTGPSRGRVVAVCLAGLYPHKNQATLLEGLALARRAGVDATLRVIGDGPEMADLYQRTIRLGIKANVEWYGAIWRRDIVEPIMAGADVFVSASRFEGMPISVLEAMAAGLPLVLSNIAAHRELAGDAAAYFDPRDPGEFATLLKEVADDRTLRDRLRERSRLRAADMSLDTSIRAHIDLYRKVA